MEVSSVLSPRIRSDHVQEEGSEDTHLRNFELESFDHQFHSMNALEILRETVRILRYNSSGFMIISALLICPLSAVVLSNVLVDHTIVKKLTVRLLLVAESSGLPLWPFIEHLCQKFSELAVSSAMCFPLYITFSSLSKSAVVYSVSATYSKKKVDFSKFFTTIREIWRRVVFTYLWMCMVIVGIITLFFMLLIGLCSTVSVIGLSPDLTVYAAMIVSLAFSVAFAKAVVTCNLGLVISVLEDVSGPRALLSSRVLIRGQIQVGLMIYLGSAIGMAFIEGLFEHRVKTLSYGDGSSRIWEGPLLVMMYSFVVLIDSMMNAVFYFSCKSYNMEEASDSEDVVIPAEPAGVQ